MSKLMLIFAVPLAVLAVTGVLVVDVREGGADGHRIVLPVPVILAQVALSVAPSQARNVECHAGERYLPLARDLAKKLRDYPDFTLAEVRERDEHVLIRKVGRDLVVDVTDAQDQVHCRVPLRMAERVLASCADGRVRTRALAGALFGLPHGDLVRVVSSDGDQVRIMRF